MSESDNDPLLLILEEQQGPIYDFSALVPLMVDIRLVVTLKVAGKTLHINEVPHSFTTEVGTLKLYHMLAEAKRRYTAPIAEAYSREEWVTEQLGTLSIALTNTLDTRLSSMASTVNTLKEGGLEIVCNLQTQCLQLADEQLTDYLGSLREDSTEVISETKETLTDLSSKIETLNKFINTPIIIK